MSVAPGLDLDLGRLPEEHASVGQQFLGPKGRNFAFGAVARTLTSILDEAEAPQVIDLLSLDVEGAEFDVLNGIDYTKYKFQNMVIECRRFDRIEAFLKEKGYVFSEKLSHHDYHIVNSSSRSSS